jgi:hypothetical protein
MLPGRSKFSSSNRCIYRLRSRLQVGDGLFVSVPDRFGARGEGAERRTRSVPGATSILRSGGHASTVGRSLSTPVGGGPPVGEIEAQRDPE